MGCGESKLAVATSNTILRRKKSSVADPSKKSKDIETVLENVDNTLGNNNSTVQQQHEQQPEDHKSSEQVKEGGGETSVVADNVNVKDINVNNNDGEGDGKEILDKAGNKEELNYEAAERLITHGSPNRFFSSRKLEEEGIDGIISEGRSGTSDYYTPRHGNKGSLFKVDDDIVEDDKELDLASETKAPEAQKNEEPVKPEVLVKLDEPVNPEEKLVKEEAEVAATTSVEAKVVEAKVSSPAEEEKK